MSVPATAPGSTGKAAPISSLAAVPTSAAIGQKLARMPLTGSHARRRYSLGFDQPSPTRTIGLLNDERIAGRSLPLSRIRALLRHRGVHGALCAVDQGRCIDARANHTELSEAKALRRRRHQAVNLVEG